jgi:hypothetical protein
MDRHPPNLASPKAAPESTHNGCRQTQSSQIRGCIMSSDDSQEWSHEVCLLMNISEWCMANSTVWTSYFISCSISAWIPFWLEVVGASPDPPGFFHSCIMLLCCFFSCPYEYCSSSNRLPGQSSIQWGLYIDSRHWELAARACKNQTDSCGLPALILPTISILPKCYIK